MYIRMVCNAERVSQDGLVYLFRIRDLNISQILQFSAHSSFFATGHDGYGHVNFLMFMDVKFGEERR